ncbi:hypothetical protein DB347_08680 [Opitutaceae bacterium EW11]|nr:hypothetical protein DB347_08680 [Opitutaceae bacterium EW11]
MTDTDPNSSARTAEWMIAGLLGANAVWTTLCLGGYRPETLVWTWLLTGCALAVHFLSWAFSTERTHPAGWLVVPFLAYAAVNVALVSPVPWLGWRDWMSWLQMAAVFWLVLNGVRRAGPRKLLLGVVLALAVVSVVLAAYQRFLWPDWLMLGRKQVPQFLGRASGPFGIPNSLAAFLILLVPACLALTFERGATAFQRILFGYASLVLLLGVGLTISRGAWLSLLVALMLWPLCVRERSWEWRLSVALAAFAAASLGGIVVYASSPRVKHRFDMLVRDAGELSRPILWRGAFQLFEEAPLTGTGAASFNVLFERHRPPRFNDNPQWAHNDYLNTLSDYGLVGGGLLFGAMAVVAVRTYRSMAARRGTQGLLFGFNSMGLTRGLSVGVLAFCLSVLVDFHFKIPALAMVFAIVAAECVLRGWPPPPERDGPSGAVQLASICAFLASALFILAVALPAYRSEAARYAARESIDRLALLERPSLNYQQTVLSEAQRGLIESCVLHPGNAQAWSDRAYVSALWSRLAPARAVEMGKEAETAAREALSASTVVPEFWIRLGVALDLQGRWAEAGPAFGRAIETAPSNVIAWYYDAYHLSLLPAARPLALSAAETALLLDPGYSPAIRLHKDLSTPH